MSFLFRACEHGASSAGRQHGLLLAAALLPPCAHRKLVYLGPDATGGLQRGSPGASRGRIGTRCSSRSSCSRRQGGSSDYLRAPIARLQRLSEAVLPTMGLARFLLFDFRRPLNDSGLADWSLLRRNRQGRPRPARPSGATIRYPFVVRGASVDWVHVTALRGCRWPSRSRPPLGPIDWGIGNPR